MQKIIEFIHQHIQLPVVRISDVIEILLISFVFYLIITKGKNTRSLTILRGILILCLLYFVSYICSFNIIMYLFKNSITFIIIGLLIIFQNEIKKTLEKLGNTNSLKKIVSFRKNNETKRYSDRTITELRKTCEALSPPKTGALIVLEMDTPLNDCASTGIKIDAEITSQLLINIFEHNTPLHDGAVLIQKDRISSATCYLPLSNDTAINKDLGTRHRAGIGMSETSDAIILIVSEETGAISIAEKGVLYHDIDGEYLENFLKQHQNFTNPIKDKSQKINILKLIKDTLMAFVVGLSVWICLINVYDPVIEKNISVPITVINDNILDELDQSYEITSPVNTSVEVSGKKSIVDKLTSNDLTATADFKNLSITNSIDVDVLLNSKYKNFVSYQIVGNKNITVSLEETAEIEIPVEVKTIGTAPSGIYVYDLTPNIDTIKVSGVKSTINTLNKAVVSVDISNANENFIYTSTPNIYDRNGTIVNTNKLTLNTDSISVTSIIYNEKEVPLNISLIDDNNFGQVVDYNCSVETIKIAAEDDVLAKIKSIDIDYLFTVPEDNTSTSIIKTIDINEFLPEGVIYISEDDSSLVNIEVSYKPYEKKIFIIPINSIDIKNKEDKYNYKITETLVKATILGPADIMDSLTIESLSPYINVYGIKPGVELVSLKFENKNVLVDQVSSVQINISSKNKNN